ncbi:chemotaxis protein CheX [Azoarcus taiwanensis]|uniref:Chemotaxis protein CheX n=1 Tax=Azoarcus taiwanensis TaxID=666964 RepID=A0A972F876_9RHOO|nr:chemotaxis protein CheX [Azoarcus taiwanensis]NMG03335.1 chemotaxis protein CheX [Azoarcus taiwanensis]
MTQIDRIMSSIACRTREYLGAEFGVTITAANAHCSESDQLTLPRMTTVIALGGNINMLVAFGFDERLIDLIFDKMTEGFEVGEDEVAMYREAATGEAVNTILGHCTSDLADDAGGVITMTPPVILEGVKTIRRMKDASFYTQNLDSMFGQVTVNLVGPRMIFDNHLDYATQENHEHR